VELSGGQFLPPVQTLVATIIFAKSENAYRVLPTRPTMRTEKDFGSENPETTTVSGFFVPFFKVLFKRYPFPKTPFGEDLNYDN